MDAAGIGSGRVAYIGLAVISGTVSRLGAAGSHRVRLYARESGKLLAETWSGTNGAYAFTGLMPSEFNYFVCAFDHSATPVNAAISDYLTPEPT